jgi:hypothetical protein
MILDQDIKPEKQAYYLGSSILRALQGRTSGPIEVLDLFEQVNQREKVSYHAFSMAMNWLYLIGAVELSDGRLTKCF